MGSLGPNTSLCRDVTPNLAAIAAGLRHQSVRRIEVERSSAAEMNGIGLVISRLGTAFSVVALPCCSCPQGMEDTMCWETDYQFWAEQRKAEIQKKQDERAAVIKDLLNEANKQADTTVTENQSLTEVASAK
jgi:hypothetical protein